MIDIIYSDKDIVVCFKPSGMLSQSDPNGEDGIKELLTELLARQSVKQLEELHIINRLDRPVCGLVLFARNKKAAAFLSAQLDDHEKFVKEYVAIVDGKVEKDAAILENFLFRDRNSGKTFVVNNERKGAKYAKLSYERLESYVIGEKQVSRLLIRLFTGRTHQIRTQLSGMGNPIAGDGKYGSRIKLPRGEIALCCYRMSFLHPTSKKSVTFVSPDGENIFDGLLNDTTKPWG